jgi:hypothetical protein
MKVKSISYPTYLEDIEDIENDNIDVFVELEDNDTYTYTVVVATAKNIEWMMDKEKMNYLRAGHPFLIVKKLTEKIIFEAIQAYAADQAYWLKLYQFSNDINPAVFAQLQTEHMDYLKELDELDNS